MPISKLSHIAALLGGVAVFVSPALAADQPANDAGSKTIADFITAYAGKAVTPSLKVQTQGSGYLVSFDLAGATAALQAAGFAYDSVAIKFSVFQQDDGQWRVELADLPPISGHMIARADEGDMKLDVRIETKNLKQTTLLDPKLGWIASSKGGADKIGVTERAPGIEEYIEFGQTKFDVATKSGAQGLTTTVTQPIGALSIVADVTPQRHDGSDGKAEHFTAAGQNGAVDASLSNFQPAPLLDAWRFYATHPARADLARDFAALKGVVTALVADHFALNETVKLDKLTLTRAGATLASMEGASFAIGVTNAGPDSSFSEHFAAKSLNLPGGLVPPPYAPMVPNKFDINFKATGFDVEAAAKEWLANAQLEGDGPAINEATRQKIGEKLIGGRPISIDFQSSSFSGPVLDISFDGKVTIDHAQPTGAIAIKLRDFDKTMKGVQNLGPEMSGQILPMLVMAKSLAKSLADGALLWNCELGQDHVIKINGMPLGKSPF